jgi:hypothetical protein
VRVLLVDEHDERLDKVVGRRLRARERVGVLANRRRARVGVDLHLVKHESRGQPRDGRHARAPEVHDAVRVVVRGGHLVDAARPERGVREHEDAHGVTFRAVGGVVTAPLQRRRHRHGVAQELVGHLQRHSRVPAAADPRGGGIELVRRLETGAFGHRRRPTRRRASRSDDWSEGGHKTTNNFVVVTPSALVSRTG